MVFISTILSSSLGRATRSDTREAGTAWSTPASTTTGRATGRVQADGGDWGRRVRNHRGHGRRLVPSDVCREVRRDRVCVALIPEEDQQDLPRRQRCREAPVRRSFEGTESEMKTTHPCLLY